MNIKELQIGNWVRHNGKAKRVHCIDFRNDGVCFDEDPYEFYDCERVEPVAITTDILARNGFTEEIRDECFGWWTCDGVTLEYTGDSRHYDGYWGFSANSDDSDVCLIVMHNVHQLQNALKLCGFDQDINL